MCSSMLPHESTGCAQVVVVVGRGNTAGLPPPPPPTQGLRPSGKNWHTGHSSIPSSYLYNPNVNVSGDFKLSMVAAVFTGYFQLPPSLDTNSKVINISFTNN